MGFTNIRNELYLIAFFLCMLYIECRNCIYSVMKYLIRLEKKSVSMTSDNAKLVLGVPAFYIKCRIRFCKSLILGLFQSLVVCHSIVVHFCKNVVGGTI